MGNYITNTKAIYDELYEIKKKKHHNFITLRISVLYNLLKTVHTYYYYPLNKFINYNFNNRTYKIMFNNHKIHIDRLIKAIDVTTDTDITEEIKEIAGPFENFHNMDLTPNMLGYQHIQFNILNIDDLSVSNINFSEDEILKI